MKSILLYNKEQAYKNKHFIDIMLDEAKNLSLDMDLVLVENLEIDFLRSQNIDFVINRQPDYKVLEKIESLGIRVHNSSEVCKIANDKALSYEFISDLGIDVLKTLTKNISYDTMPFPYILKPRDLRGGEGVSLINSKDDYNKYIEKYDIEKSIQQELASDIGKDLRVYILGNKILTAMLRTSKNSFKSNYSLGGRAEKYNLNDVEKNIVNIIISNFDFDYVGIDFLFHNGKIVFNEIEDPVGARMIYHNTHINPARLLIENCIKINSK